MLFCLYFHCLLLDLCEVGSYLHAGGRGSQLGELTDLPGPFNFVFAANKGRNHLYPLPELVGACATLDVFEQGLYSELIVRHILLALAEPQQHLLQERQ